MAEVKGSLDVTQMISSLENLASKYSTLAFAALEAENVVGREPDVSKFTKQLQKIEQSLSKAFDPSVTLTQRNQLISSIETTLSSIRAISQKNVLKVSEDLAAILSDQKRTVERMQSNMSTPGRTWLPPSQPSGRNLVPISMPAYQASTLDISRQIQQQEQARQQKKQLKEENNREYAQQLKEENNREYILDLAKQGELLYYNTEKVHAQESARIVVETEATKRKAKQQTYDQNQKLLEYKPVIKDQYMVRPPTIKETQKAVEEGQKLYSHDVSGILPEHFNSAKKVDPQEEALKYLAVINSASKLTPDKFAEFEDMGVKERAKHYNELSQALVNYGKLYGTVIDRTVEGETRVEEAEAKELAAAVGWYDQSIKNADRSTNGMVVSWKSFERLILARLVTQVFYAMSMQLRQTLAEVEDLSIAIGEIETISHKSQLATSEWAAILSETSSKFGFEQKDVAEALYQTLSNQVAQGQQAAGFLSDAAMFAKVTKSTLTESVNLLSSGIKSFGMDVSETTDLAAQFFKVIELGRVRAKDMESAFGRIGAITKTAGISFTDLGAQIAMMTTRGVSFERASTYILNVTNKLLKPTKEMQSLFQEWGVASGEAAIKVYGLSGILDKIAQSSHGSIQDLVTETKDIRAIIGMSMMTTGLDDFKKAREEIGASMRDYLKAQEEAFSTSGAIVGREKLKIKAEFIEMGNIMLNGIAALPLAKIFNASSLFSAPLMTLGATKMAASWLSIDKDTLKKVNDDMVSKFNAGRSSADHFGIALGQTASKAELYSTAIGKGWLNTKSFGLTLVGLAPEIAAVGVALLTGYTLLKSYIDTAKEVPLTDVEYEKAKNFMIETQKFKREAELDQQKYTALINKAYQESIVNQTKAQTQLANANK